MTPSSAVRALERVRPLARGILFAVVTVVVFSWNFIYDRAKSMESWPDYPPPNFLGSTWYGPILVLLSPLLLFWFIAGVKRPWARALGLFFGILLLLVCLLAIWVAMSAVSTLPAGIPRYNGV